jgi:hypothetical protein
MKETEVAELRRRFRADKSNISSVCGCYVNDRKEIIAQFRQSLGLLPQNECEQILALLKKSLSGTMGKNLLDITFETQQVAGSDEHGLLMSLRSSSLGDDAAVQEFYRRVIETLQLEGNYMILLAHDAYDVPYKAKDDETQQDASEEVFTYLVCAVCPMKLTKPALSYYVHEQSFHSIAADYIISPPELGFLFPAFDDRSTNLYNALYYTRDLAENHTEFVDSIFHAPVPMPAAAQKEAFQTLLSDAVGDECSLTVVQAVHDQLAGMIEEHKANRGSEPPKVSKSVVKNVLKSCGVADERVDAFDQQYDDAFGADTQISPVNVVDPKQIEMKMPDVVIRVNPDRSDLVQTRILDGARYILIRAEEGVEVNGVTIHIPRD